MRTRSISAVGVVIVGLVPAFFGGSLFAVAWALLCLIGYVEYLGLADPLGQPRLGAAIGAAVVAGLALVGLSEARLLPMALIAVGTWAPLLVALARAPEPGLFSGWALTAAGTLYLGLPAYAVVTLRQLDGAIEADWLRSLSETMALGWSAQPRGLSWFLLVLAVTWIADTAAYLVGRSWGRRPLIPTVSPKKTIEGSIGGLTGAAATGALGVWLFGLEVHPLLGAGFGIVLGVAGQLGDLVESLLKRQVGVKDTGALIPGHGGMLDRIDALLMTFPVGWALAEVVDRWLQ